MYRMGDHQYHITTHSENFSNIFKHFLKTTEDRNVQRSIYTYTPTWYINQSPGAEEIKEKEKNLFPR